MTNPNYIGLTADSLDVYTAHALAEQVRQWATERWESAPPTMDYHAYLGALDAADLIDPYVETPL